MVKRKAERRFRKSDKKSEKKGLNDQIKEKQKQPTWRRDKNGNWIFKNSIRFSYIGIFVTVIVLAGLIVFGYAVGMIWLTDYCVTTDMIACGFVPEQPKFIPENERDFAEPIKDELP